MQLLSSCYPKDSPETPGCMPEMAQQWAMLHRVRSIKVERVLMIKVHLSFNHHGIEEGLEKGCLNLCFFSSSFSLDFSSSF